MRKLPAVLVHFPSVGGRPIMIDVNYTVALQWISPKLHTLHFLCTAKGICAYRWRVELQSGASVWNCGWQTPTSPLLMERFQLIRHILHLSAPRDSPHIHSPFAPCSTQTWANFQTHTVNVLIGHLWKDLEKSHTVQLSNTLMKLLLIMLAFSVYYVFHYDNLL